MVEEESHESRAGQQLPGTKVWAKLKGFPWWPGQIADESAMTKTAVSAKRTSTIPVLFYGSNDYSWLPQADIKPFNEGSTPDTPRKPTDKLLDAIRLAKEDGAPTGRPPPGVPYDVSDEEEGVTEDEPSLEDGKTTGKKHRAPTSRSSRKSTPKSTRTPKTPKTSVTPRTPSLSSAGKTSKRKATSTAGSAKRRKAERIDNVEVEDVGHGEGSHGEKKPIKEEKKQRLPFEQLLYLRHKVQKLMKDGSDSLARSGRMDACLREIENFPMTVDLLKETKVGKLMKKITQMAVDPDPNNFKERAGALISKWKAEFNLDKEPEQVSATNVAEQPADHPESDNKPTVATDGEEEQQQANLGTEDTERRVEAMENAESAEGSASHIAKPVPESEDIPRQEDAGAGATSDKAEDIATASAEQRVDGAPRGEEHDSHVNGHKETSDGN